MNRKIVRVKIADIKIDNDQPRVVKDPEAIRNLAANMKEVGLINPIELDEDNVIVTGESRYLAAQQLGWPDIEVTYVKRDSDVKLRQLSENMIRKDMDPYDIAAVLKRMVDEYEPKRKTGFTPGRPDGAVTGVARRIGMSRTTVHHYLALLKNDDQELTAFIRKNKIPFRIASIIAEESDDRLRDFLKRKLYDGTMSRWTLITRVKSFLKETGNYDLAEEILAEGKSKGLLENDIERRFHAIKPKLGMQLAQNLQPGQRLIAAMSAANLALAEVKLEDVAPIHYGRLLTTYELLRQKVDNFNAQLLLGAGETEKQDEHKAIQEPARERAR